MANNSGTNPQQQKKKAALSEELTLQFIVFARHTPMYRLTKTLRKLLLAYVKSGPVDGAEISDEESFDDQEKLFDLLDTIEIDFNCKN